MDARVLGYVLGVVVIVEFVAGRGPVQHQGDQHQKQANQPVTVETAWYRVQVDSAIAPS